jgi:hypothetical protein
VNHASQATRVQKRGSLLRGALLLLSASSLSACLSPDPIETRFVGDPSRYATDATCLSQVMANPGIWRGWATKRTWTFQKGRMRITCARIQYE